jgi:hypothetical protein
MNVERVNVLLCTTLRGAGTKKRATRLKKTEALLDHADGLDWQNHRPIYARGVRFLSRRSEKLDGCPDGNSERVFEHTNHAAATNCREQAHASMASSSDATRSLTDGVATPARPGLEVANDPRQFISGNRSPTSASVSSYSASTAAVTAICARRRATTANARRAVLAGQKTAETTTEVSKTTVTTSGVAPRPGVADAFEPSN